MKQQPFFSIVIPTYNREAFIQATLASVLSQTYPHYEVIIVDNCSTDNTVGVLQPYIAAGQVTLIQHEQNYERARSRNTGMSAAKGDFLTFLDSDDFMYPTNLEDAADFIRENPGVKCFHNLYELLDAQGNVIRRYKLPPLTNQLKAIAAGNFMSCIGDFIHAEIYRQYRFDTDPLVSGAEDWDFWLRVLADYKVERLEKVNNGILHHEGRSINNQNLANMRLGLERVVSKLATDPHLSKVYQPYLKRIRANAYIYLAILANTHRLYDEAKGLLRQAARADLSILTNDRFYRALRVAWFKISPRKS